MLKFFWNGIKDNGGKLQTCSYSAGQLINHPAGTITIYKKSYEPFSAGIQAAFAVQNDTEIITDYIVQDVIRVEPTHPLYHEVKKAYNAYQAHWEKRAQQHALKQAAKARLRGDRVMVEQWENAARRAELGMC